MTNEEFSKLISRTKFPRTFEGRDGIYLERPASYPLSEYPDLRRKIPLAPIGVGSITNYVPTPRERIVDFLTRHLYGEESTRRDRAEFILKMIDATPGGIPLAASDTSRAVSEGRYKDAILPGIATAAPFVGKPARMMTGMKGTGQAEVIKDIVKPAKAPDILRPEGNGLTIATPELPPLPQQVGSYKVTSGKFENKLKTDRQVSERAGFSIPEPAIPGRMMFWQRSSPWIVAKGPMARPPRPFSVDYPQGALTDEDGNLLYDIEGRPLTASRIAGRRKLNGRDERVGTDDTLSLVNDMGAEILRVPRSGLIEPRSVGDAWYHMKRGPEFIQIWDALPEDQAGVTLDHETGHMLDFISNEVLRKAPKEELNRLYSEAITGQKRSRYLTLPQTFDYTNEQAPLEKAAEAFRVYKNDPNTMKTIAPRTAALIRTFNTHPFFKKHIQFNNIPLATGFGIGALAKSANDNESQASESPQVDETMPSKRGGAKFRPLVRALAALSSRQKGPVYGGPR